MIYVRLKNDGTIQKYPFEIFNLPGAFPDVSFFQPLELNDLSFYRVHPVTEVAPPAYNQTTHVLSELDPVEIGGVWTQQWSVTALSAPDAVAKLDKVRKDRWKEVKTLRDNKIRNGGIPLNGEWYPSDAAAKSDILWVLSIGSNTGQRIELLDGSMANLTVARATDLRAEGATQSAAIAAYADTLKTQIDASSDPDSIDITVGWPAVYVPI